MIHVKHDVTAKNSSARAFGDLLFLPRDAMLARSWES